jgi:stalled ribosome alternative rescue factor ArfA
MMKRNMVAKNLRDTKAPYRMKVVGAKKGKGSFQRREKYAKNFAE